MMKIPKLAAAVLALCLALPGCGRQAPLTGGQDLLANGSFEAHDGAAPDGWTADSWDREEGFSLFSVDTADGNSGAAAVVENAELNDARFQQTVAVERGKLYRLSGDIKVEGAEGDWGANLSFKDTYTHTGRLTDTNGQWKHVELYARASRDQKETTVYIRLGGYGNLSRGKAWFDNVRLEQVESLPEGVTEGTMATHTPAKDTGGGRDGTKHLAEIVVIAMLYGAAMLWAFKRIGTAGAGGLKTGLYAAGIVITGNLLTLLQAMQGKDYNWVSHVFCSVFLGLIPGLALLFFRRRLAGRDRRWIDVAYAGYVAVIVRVFLAITIRGYENDMSCWLGWAGQAANDLFGMYKGEGFLDYPPGYLYVLFFVGKINSLIPLAEVQWLIAKLPAIIADIATAYFIYRIALTRIGAGQAAALGLLYAFNPLVILDSAAWGQIDSILALVVVGCFWQAYRGRLWQAALIYGIGLLIKPQMLLFGPALLSALIVACRNTKHFGSGALLFLKTAGASLAGFVLPALPFIIAQGDPMWLPNLYIKATGTYESATVNACNLLALLGGNWVADTQLVFGIPYSTLGWAGMILTVSFTLGFVIFREKTNRKVFLWAAVLIAGMFVLGLRMHERYMFPALALLLMHYALERDRRALYLFGLFSITQFLNVAMVLANEHMPTDVLRMGDAFAIANPDGAGYWVFVISLAAVASFAYMAYAAVKANRPLVRTITPENDPSGGETAAETVTGDEGESPLEERIASKERRRNELERIREDLSAPPESPRLGLKKKDWLLMGALTVAYAVVSLLYLGTTKVPQTMWQAFNTGDWAVVDFGKTVPVAQIWHYDGLTKGNLQLSTSDDGMTWSPLTEFKHKATASGENDDLGIYRWDIAGVDVTARYVKFEVKAPPVRLLEAVFKDADGNILPARISDAGGSGKAKAQAGNIIDEQSLTPERPSVLNGTYFDEIYHARTGWEFTEALRSDGSAKPPIPYETTHPPLGKDLIAFGIMLFGMNPFGWRFMGTLMGILMVPAMYLFGMAVFRRTRYAFIASFLFTFDFMHFVQTRISTIDSYVVLFIILTFLCMYLYLKTNFNSQKLGRTLLPLALSGVFFGLAAASKWIGLYAGAGLAVIFFYGLYRRFREYLAVKRGEVELDDEIREKVLRGFPGKVLLTLLWCLVFFVIVPAAIYMLSYIPFNIGTGGDASHWNDVKIVLDNQRSMFNYHSRLVDNHPYKSPWFQWPVMAKPMWFYKAGWLPEGWMGGIFTFGNPAVWWTGLAAMVWLAVRVFRSKKFRLPESFMLAGFLIEYLPWVLVPRTMFIYHYFASVPFFVMAIVLFIRDWERKPFRGGGCGILQAIIALGAAVAVSLFISPILAAVLGVFLIATIVLYRRQDTASLHKPELTHVYMAVVLALFILFYPMLSGLPIPQWYGGWLKWLSSWYFVY